MKKYEYKMYTCDDRDLSDETLNEFGREGWELVTHSTAAFHFDDYGDNVWHYFFFRRPLVPTEESCHDDDDWTNEKWHEHQKYIAKLARELRETLE